MQYHALVAALEHTRHPAAAVHLVPQVVCQAGVLQVALAVSLDNMFQLVAAARLVRRVLYPLVIAIQAVCHVLLAAIALPVHRLLHVRLTLIAQPLVSLPLLNVILVPMDITLRAQDPRHVLLL